MLDGGGESEDYDEPLGSSCEDADIHDDSESCFCERGRNWSVVFVEQLRLETGFSRLSIGIW